MPNSFLTLADFLEPVVTIAPPFYFSQLSRLFCRGENAEVIVVDTQFRPQGVIYAQDLLAQYLNSQSDDSSQEYLTAARIPKLIKPIKIFPNYLTVVEYYTKFWQTQKVTANDICVLVNGKKTVTGKLNQIKILESISLQNLPTRNLWTILDRFPIPVMLKTSQGKILAQNHKWRQNIGNFIPSDELLQEQYPGKWQKINLREDKLNTVTTLIKEQIRPETLNSQLIQAPEDRESTELRQKEWEFCQIALDKLDAIPADADREKLVWLILAHDLSQQQEIYRELTSQQIDLIELNKIKDEFLACISHDLKSPLTAIVGLSSLLQETKLGKLNSRQAHYVQLIYQSGRKMMTLVNQLLDLTRLETGQLELTWENVSIVEICHKVYAEVKERIEEEKLEFSQEIETELLTIEADSRRLAQILTHLLNNAIDASQKGDKIGLKVNRWQNRLAFTVWDTGIGISAESQQLITPQYQTSLAGFQSELGSNSLGLILSQRLAQIHGGDISFVSQEGQGSEFTVLMPIESEKAKLADNQVYPIVLLVEVIPEYIGEMNKILQKLGYRVVIARSGTEAWEKARQLKPYAIILNPSLPLLSGWDVLTLLKSEPETQEIPVILNYNPSEAMPAIASEVVGILTPPIQEESLGSYLKNLSRDNQQQPQNLTILYIYPESESVLNNDAPLDWLLNSCQSGLVKRVLEADNIEQASLLAQVWEIDAIVFNSGRLDDPTLLLKRLANHKNLAQLPIITLDNSTTQLANRLSNLQVFPCLIPPEAQNFEHLLQVIEIALTSSKHL